jgi:phage shock protein C
MQSIQPNVFTRPDTLLGVCEALGEDFRFNPILLRVPFAALLIFFPIQVLATYAGLVVLVLVSRWFAPNARPAKAVEAAPAQAAPVAENEAEAMAVAA